MKGNGKHGRRARSGEILAALCACALAVPLATLAQQHGGAQHAAPTPHYAAPVARHAPQPAPRPQASQGQVRPNQAGAISAPGRSQFNTAQPARPGQQHLPEWFEHHPAQSPQQQEQALRGEPGFARLPAQQQQSLVNRLHTLDSAPPEQRARILARNENFEHLPPERKQEIRGASQALSQMQPDRQRMVRRAFQDLRTLPPDQRQNALSSARFQAEYSPQERTVLGNLLAIEPYQH